MKRYLINAAIAAALVLPIPLLLGYLEATNPGLDLGVAGVMAPIGIWLILFQGLNTMSGNRKTTVADSGAKAQALQFVPEPGRGRIVVYRASLTNPMVGYDVEVDELAAAQLRPKQFTVVSVPAGRHTVFADIPSGPSVSATPPLAVEVGEGAILFFRTRMKMEMTRNSVVLDPQPDNAATRAEVGRLALVESSLPAA